MKIDQAEFNFYADTLIIQSMLGNGHLTKIAAQGNFIGPLIQQTKEYVESHMDPNNKLKSAINFLAPSAVSLLLKSLGFGWTGALMGLLMNVLHVDVSSILESMYNKVKPLLTSGQPVTSSQVDEAANEVASAQGSEDSDFNDDMETLSHKIHNARIIRLAIAEYQATNNIVVSAKFLPNKAKVVQIFTSVIGWIFKVILAATGLMAAGDVVNKVVGGPNAFDKTLQHGKPTKDVGTFEKMFKSKIQPTITPAVTQSKFKVKSNYSDIKENAPGSNWVVNITNNRQNIEQMVINFAKEVYNLEDLDNVIKSSATFQTIVNQIVFFNKETEGDPAVWIPRQFVSKKQLVDFFIDEVAAKSP